MAGRLDATGWRPLHTRIVLALAIGWALDSFEIQIIGSVFGPIGHDFHLSATQTTDWYWTICQRRRARRRGERGVAARPLETQTDCVRFLPRRVGECARAGRRRGAALGVPDPRHADRRRVLRLGRRGWAPIPPSRSSSRPISERPQSGSASRSGASARSSASWCSPKPPRHSARGVRFSPWRRAVAHRVFRIGGVVVAGPGGPRGQRGSSGRGLTRSRHRAPIHSQRIPYEAS